MDAQTNISNAVESQFSSVTESPRGFEVVKSVASSRSSYRGPRPNRGSKASSLETLQGLLRGEASIYVAQIDRQLPLSSDRLLKLAWLASELASVVELRG